MELGRGTRKQKHQEIQERRSQGARAEGRPSSHEGTRAEITPPGSCRVRLAQWRDGVGQKGEQTLVKLPFHVNKEERALPSHHQSFGGV